MWILKRLFGLNWSVKNCSSLIFAVNWQSTLNREKRLSIICKNPTFNEAFWKAELNLFFISCESLLKSEKVTRYPWILTSINTCQSTLTFSNVYIRKLQVAPLRNFVSIRISYFFPFLGKHLHLLKLSNFSEYFLQM